MDKISDKHMRSDEKHIQTPHIFKIKPNSQKQKFIVLFSLVLIVLVGIGGFFLVRYMLGSSSQLKTSTSKEQNSILSFSPNDTYILKNNTVFLVRDKSEKEIITNVPNDVLRIRSGFDGKTIHFQRESPPRCVNLFDHNSLSNRPGFSQSELVPPWNFNEIGRNSRFPTTCENGYLHNSDYFVSLVIEDNSSGLIVIDDRNGKQVASISFTSLELPEYWDIDTLGRGITGVDGKRYFYPDNDSYLVNDKLVLKFNTMIIGVDTKKQKLLGKLSLEDPDLENTYGVYTLLTSDKHPLTLLTHGEYGNGDYVGLLDFSGDTLEIIKLKAYDRSGYKKFNLRKHSWITNGIEMTFYREINLDNEIEDIKTKYNISYAKEEEIALAEKEALVRLRSTGKYIDVKCNLSPGVAWGCYAAVDVVTYRYTINEGLKKL